MALPQRIAIVGGGISGLAAARRARELDPSAELTLFEAAGQLGGILQTVRRAGFLIERSADSFITNTPWAIELCRRIGFDQQLLPTNADRRAFIVCRGKLQPVPRGFTLLAPSRLGPILKTPILSPWGKLRLLCEYFVPARRSAQGTDETLASFARRRLGKQAFERLVQPLVGGIYTADPEQLSLAATLPRFLEMERKHGGLIRGVRADRTTTEDGLASDEASGARYSMFVAPREGMSSLVQALADSISALRVRLNSPIGRLARDAEGRWQLPLEGAPQPEVFDRLIIATPVGAAARLLRELQPALASELAAIELASSAIVCVAYRQEQFSQPLAGFGFVVPSIERRSLLSVSYASLKYPGRAPEGTVLLRVFFGGALQPQMAEQSDAELLAATQRELADLLGVRGDPLLHEVARWPNAMPQFHLGHVERVERIGALAAGLKHFGLASNAFYGVGIPHCVRSGQFAAEQACAGPCR
ncbi:MAG TPA: protoporphyrinogen oxidase [Pirellulales bacterium]|jgi:oxygen-dependent protoporphyrinogen oxidase|nr:protoporphyrinogen oxidase [Pirellulales bacterium]